MPVSGSPFERFSRIVREEQPGDIPAIRQIVTAAFGRTDEASLVDALREAGDAVFSLVAVENDRVVGHVTLSRMAAPIPALALAPISVLPERQRTGIGAGLVRDAIARSRPDWAAIFVLGDPRYYGRFGFDQRLAMDYQSPYAGPHFMALVLAKPLPIPTGTLRHAAAFAKLK